MIKDDECHRLMSPICYLINLSPFHALIIVCLLCIGDTIAPHFHYLKTYQFFHTLSLLSCSSSCSSRENGQAWYVYINSSSSFHPIVSFPHILSQFPLRTSPYHNQHPLLSFCLSFSPWLCYECLGRGGAAGNKFRVTTGLPVGAILNCADNTGAKNLYIISVKGHGAHLNRLPAAAVGDMIIASVKKGKPELRKKGKLLLASICTILILGIINDGRQLPCELIPTPRPWKPFFH